MTIPKRIALLIFPHLTFLDFIGGLAAGVAFLIARAIS